MEANECYGTATTDLSLEVKELEYANQRNGSLANDSLYADINDPEELYETIT